MIFTNVEKIEKFSEGKIHLIEYPVSYYRDWIKKNTDFLRNSTAPEFIKEILIYKNRTRPHLFFGEAYVAMKLGGCIANGWFNSWDWISSTKWLNGTYRSNDSVIYRMMKEFYRDAICCHINEKLLKNIIKIQDDIALKAEPPDLWLIGHNKKHHFIEVKRGTDKLSREQILGLTLIHKILGHDIHVVWLYETGTELPNDKKLRGYIDNYRNMQDKVSVRLNTTS